MRWPWSKKVQPETPKAAYVVEPKPPPAPGIVVNELDHPLDEEALKALRKAQTETGFHRALNREKK